MDVTRRDGGGLPAWLGWRRRHRACGKTRLLAYAAVVWTVFQLFVVLYEEPPLRSRFGDEYRRYCAEVHRWRPRLRP